MFIIVSTRQKAVVGQGHGGYQNKLSRDKWYPMRACQSWTLLGETDWIWYQSSSHPITVTSSLKSKYLFSDHWIRKLIERTVSRWILCQFSFVFVYTVQLVSLWTAVQRFPRIGLWGPIMKIIRPHIQTPTLQSLATNIGI